MIRASGCLEPNIARAQSIFRFVVPVVALKALATSGDSPEQVRWKILCFTKEQAHVPNHRKGFPSDGGVFKTCEPFVRFACALDASS
jgi:hypothetical protein